MPSLIPFNFEKHSVRAVIVNDEPWFVGKDVAAALGYADEAQAIKDNCRRSKSLKDIASVYKTEGIPGNAKMIQEPDVYRLIVRSRLPSAEKFESWVFEEVLPSIRKTGKYELRAQLQRETARLEYRPMTDALREERQKLGKATNWFHFANEADLINRIALGMTAAEFKAFHNIGNGSIRDYLTELQVKCIADLQRANTVFLSMGMAFQERKEQLKTLFERNHHEALIEEHFRITA